MQYVRKTTRRRNTGHARPGSRLGPGIFLSFSLLSGTALADLPRHAAVPPTIPESAHADHMRMFGDHAAPVPKAEVPSTSGLTSTSPDRTVYGYWPYWGDPLSTLEWDKLTHVALFAVSLNADGSLSNTYYWTNYAQTALSLGAPYGVRIHMTVTCFDSSVMTAVLSSASTRNRAVSEIASLINDYGGDGANIDFEGLPSSQKANFVTFIEDLRAEVEDLFIAMPAVDWSGAYDFDALADASDGLFIMGYNYHWSTGDPGPNAPLYGGDPWSVYSLDWTVDDYLTYGAPANRLILGLPLYAYEWPTTNNDVPGDATGTATALFYSTAVADGEAYGRQWESLTHTPYAFPDSHSQLWYDDVISLEDKIAYAIDRNLQGVGFWALTYEDSDPEFWDMVEAQTSGGGTPCADDDGDGFTTCGGDCDDADPDTYPGADEIPDDGVDNNCNGEIDEPTSPGCGASLNPREAERYTWSAILAGMIR